MRERDIEKWIRLRIESMGGRAFKFTSPGNNGMPDRIAVLPGGRIYFIELKADGGRLSPLQVWQQRRLAESGCNVRTIRGMDEARSFIEEVAENGI